MHDIAVPDQKLIKITKQAVLARQSYKKKVVPDYVVKSWQVSQKGGLDPDCTMLTSGSIDPDTLNRISDYKKYIRNRMDEYYNSKHDLLDQAGAAIFYLDHNLAVFSKGGNGELLAVLKSKNIRFGTSFSEAFMGTNAAPLAYKRQKTVWIYGEEHYLSMLKDYVTVALRINAVETYMCVIIFPLKNFNGLSRSMAKFMFETEAAAARELPENTIANELLRLVMEQNNAVVVMTDATGNIVWVNNQYENLFRKGFDAVVGTKLAATLPELDAAIQGCYSGRPVNMQEIYLPGLPSNQNHFFMTCVPVQQDGQLVGMGISMTFATVLKDQMSAVMKKGAFFTFDQLKGRNKKFLYMKDLAKQAALSASNVLILGETGTGKELFAQAIHNGGKRKNKPFIPLNCAAIPRELIGSELFGYEEGAFTGARRGGAPGKFELANGGTLFLDEIAEMPLDMQSVLLRVLEDKVFTRVGGNKPIDVDVRLIAATNRDIWKEVNDGKFRLDLYFRLNVIKLEMVPLRERMNDLEILANNFVNLIAPVFGKAIDGIAPEVFNLFARYSWPGNVRELRNVIERCINMCNTNLITLADIPHDMINQLSSEKNFELYENPQVAQYNKNIPDYQDYARDRLKLLMIKHNGNKSAVAAELGISRNTLYRRLQELDG